MKYLSFFWKMLRYRVALMLIMFYWFGMATHNSLEFSLPMVIGIISLSLSYISATTLNDIADVNIDKINHKNHSGRLLVTGEASIKDMVIVHLVASLSSLILAFFINFQAVFIISLSLLVNYLYSVSPFKISHRTYLAPVLLAFAYVAIPYWLGVITVGGWMIQSDFYWIITLMLLFLGRIVLKDFRDREGDKTFGKPTFLLKYGKVATCLLSTIFIFGANILLFFELRSFNFVILILIEVLFVAIYLSEYFLFRARGKDNEQKAIGIGAKMGNGMLLTVLGLLLLISSGAKFLDQLIFSFMVVGLYLTSFVHLIKNPKKVILGYKG